MLYRDDEGMLTLHTNNTDHIYNEINERKCSMESWYKYISWITTDKYFLTFDNMHGG